VTQQVEVQILAEIFIHGHPKTKGSLEVVTPKYVRERPGSSRWRKLVADRLRVDYGKRAEAIGVYDEGMSGPYAGRTGVRIVSYLQPPASWLARVQEWLVSQFSGDGDKLARNVLDALTDSGLIVDDGQVWDLFSHKRLAAPGTPPGQHIQVWIIPESAPWT